MTEVRSPEDDGLIRTVYLPATPDETAPATHVHRQLTDTNRASAALKVLDYAAMTAMPEPEWLVEGAIQKRSAALLFGKSNSFKSFLAIDLGLHVQTGQDWHGSAVAQGSVLFVVTEGANGVGRLRIPTWYDHHNVCTGKRSGFLCPHEICLDVEADVTALIAAMHDTGPFALIILDIFGSTMAGSEVEDKTARAWVHGVQRIIRETGASILVVAHTGWSDDTRARMHTHFWGSFDTRLRVVGDKNALTAVMTVDRHKDADSGGEWGFRLVQTGTSLVPVLDRTVKASKASSLKGQKRVALQALDEALAEHGIKKEGANWPNCPVVPLERWRETCGGFQLSTSDEPAARKKAFQRAQNALRERGLVVILDGHVWKVTDKEQKPMCPDGTRDTPIGVCPCLSRLPGPWTPWDMSRLVPVCPGRSWLNTNC